MFHISHVTKDSNASGSGLKKCYELKTFRIQLLWKKFTESFMFIHVQLITQEDFQFMVT